MKKRISQGFLLISFSISVAKFYLQRIMLLEIKKVFLFYLKKKRKIFNLKFKLILIWTFLFLDSNLLNYNNKKISFQLLILYSLQLQIKIKILNFKIKTQNYEITWNNYYKVLMVSKKITRNEHHSFVWLLQLFKHALR